MAFLDETGLNHLWQQIVAKLGNYMTKDNPSGTGALSLNRKASTSVGTYSVAEGKNNTATGYAAHAEGTDTTSSADSTHAEGYKTTASAWYAHAEGNTTTASNRAAHAEGGYTTASGQQSHAEGFQTIAASTSQHVQGKYNIEDAADTYAHIVGNGSSDGRSNAHTLDWYGNAWYAGTIKIGGTGQDDTAASEVATKSYVDNATANAGTQPDWKETDETSPAYIKNKPTEEGAFMLLCEIGIIEPAVDSDGTILTDENGYVLSC